MVAHEEMIAMSHLDQEIHNKFVEQEKNIIFNIIDILKKNNIILNNSAEKIHIAYNLIENLCHELYFINIISLIMMR